MRAAGIICLLAASFALTCVGFFVLRLSDDLHGVTQDTRAELLQVDTTLGKLNARLEELKPILTQSKDTVAELHASARIAHRYLDSDDFNAAFQNMVAASRESVRVQESAQKALDSVPGLIAETHRAVHDVDAAVNDPAIKATLDEVQKTSANVTQVTANLAATTEKIDRKAEQMLKPASLLNRIGKTLLGWTSVAVKIFY